MKKRSKRTYAIRRAVAMIYMFAATLIGLPMAIIGSGLDSDKFNSKLYWIGVFLAGTGLILLSIFSAIIDEVEREKEAKYNNRRNHK